MKQLQKLVTIVLAFVLALSLSLTALAATGSHGENVSEANQFQDNKAETTVSIISAPKNLSATVPLKIVFAVGSDGKFICPAGYEIKNTGADVFHVSDIKVTMLDGKYSLVDNSAPEKGQVYLTMTATNSFVPTLADKVTLVSGVDNTPQDFAKTSDSVNVWNIIGGEKIAFEFEGRMNSADSSKLEWTTPNKLFSIAYTIVEGEVIPK